MYKMHIISYEVQEYIITNTQNYRIFLQKTGFVLLDYILSNSSNNTTSPSSFVVTFPF